jgi:hypothetical protein
MRRRSLFATAGLLAALATGPRTPSPAPAATGGYAAMAVAADSTLDSALVSGSAARRFGGAVSGRLSVAGLPPVDGELELTPEALVFHPAQGDAETVIYPVVRQRRLDDGRVVRRSTVRPLGPAAAERPVYLYHLDGSTFETRAPGMLAELASGPAWLDSLEASVVPGHRTLVDARDSAAQAATIDSLMRSAYADSLFQLFGRPTRPVGLVGSTGASARRLGEYIASRDSLSLAPGRMTNAGQLRHGFTHELAHRWQRSAPAALTALWRDVPPIRDSLRYGYDNAHEHQAEAIAFAVHYLQASAAPARTPAERASLLDSYERLVPGTRAVARWLLAQPLYARHPLVRTPLAPVAVVAASPLHGTE